ncbi:hypothetical protein SUGI_1484910 [Cryptomeria japonica]|uniref:Uncharacterized protein n=1 Tax=Cryptomeria japonica TaxID=3369 RepID=A0AAD3RRI2_CRYJA|nr:hypothetical protein SUGI_1484910 [Cryptomeria japonica]
MENNDGARVSNIGGVVEAVEEGEGDGAPRTSFWTMRWWLVKGGSDESDVGMLVAEDVEVARDFALFCVVSFSAPMAVLGA